MTIVACGDDNDDSSNQPLTPAVTINPTSLSFNSDGDSQDVTVNAASPFARSEASWITISKKSSTAKEAVYTITCQENTTYDERSGSVLFNNGGEPARLTVTQAGKATPPPPATYSFRSAKEIAKDMYPGWNLGNTMEATGGETSWQSTKTTQDIINFVKAKGFKSVRIPCSWAIHCDAKGKIDATWMARVKEVVGYCITAGLYVELNDHWDGGWIEVEGFSKSSDKYQAVTEEIIAEKETKLRDLWTQIAEAFENYDEHLLFAGLNEPFQEYSLFSTRHKELTPILERYNKAFCEAVRATGGNNLNRTLVVQGPATSIPSTNSYFNVPATEATSGKLMVEVHYYTPWDFCGNESTSEKCIYWGKDQGMSGYNAETEIDSEFKLMYNKFVKNNIPVLIGEYAANWRDLSSVSSASQDKHDASIKAFYKAVNMYGTNYGIIPFAWDINSCSRNGSKGTSTIIDRKNLSVFNQIALDAIMEGASAGKWPY